MPAVSLSRGRVPLFGKEKTMKTRITFIVTTTIGMLIAIGDPTVIAIGIAALMFGAIAGISRSKFSGEPKFTLTDLAQRDAAPALIRGAMRWLSTHGSRPAPARGDAAYWANPVSAPLAVAILLRFLAGEPLDALRREIDCSPERFEMRLRAAIRLLLSLRHA
jgi:hypothetical protein